MVTVIKLAIASCSRLENRVQATWGGVLVFRASPGVVQSSGHKGTTAPRLQQLAG